jgi:hypothetical protein
MGLKSQRGLDQIEVELAGILILRLRGVSVGKSGCAMDMSNSRSLATSESRFEGWIACAWLSLVAC